MSGRSYSLRSVDRWRCLLRGTLFVFLSAITFSVLVNRGFSLWITFLFLVFFLGTFLEISRFITWDRPRIIFQQDQIVIMNYWGFGTHLIPLTNILDVESSQRVRSNNILFIRVKSSRPLSRGQRSFAVWTADFEAGEALRTDLIALME